jgi:hypothetical protein
VEGQAASVSGRSELGVVGLLGGGTITGGTRRSGERGDWRCDGWGRRGDRLRRRRRRRPDRLPCDASDFLLFVPTIQSMEPTLPPIEITFLPTGHRQKQFLVVKACGGEWTGMVLEPEVV